MTGESWVRTIRVVAGLVLLIIGTVLIADGVGVISNIWDSYKDSPDSTYLTFGGGFLLVGFAICGLGIWALVGGRRTRVTNPGRRG